MPKARSSRLPRNGESKTPARKGNLPSARIQSRSTGKPEVRSENPHSAAQSGQVVSDLWVQTQTKRVQLRFISLWTLAILLCGISGVMGASENVSAVEEASETNPMIPQGESDQITAEMRVRGKTPKELAESQRQLSAALGVVTKDKYGIQLPVRIGELISSFAEPADVVKTIGVEMPCPAAAKTPEAGGLFYKNFGVPPVIRQAVAELRIWLEYKGHKLELEPEICDVEQHDVHIHFVVKWKNPKSPSFCITTTFWKEEFGIVISGGDVGPGGPYYITADTDLASHIQEAFSKMKDDHIRQKTGITV